MSKFTDKLFNVFVILTVIMIVPILIASILIDRFKTSKREEHPKISDNEWDYVDDNN